MVNWICAKRLTAQRTVTKTVQAHPKKTIAGGAAAIALSISLLIQPSEGLRTTAYLDTVAKPPVWTVCYGETKGVKKGDKYTVDQCKDMLFARVTEDFDKPLSQCFKDWYAKPDYWRAAVISWAYNVGTGAACKSTLRKKADAGDLKSACRELLKWDKAGGKTIKGLTNRRKTELEVCLK